MNNVPIRTDKKYTKKTPGNNNVCNLPPTDLALLPHKTPDYKTQKKSNFMIR